MFVASLAYVELSIFITNIFNRTAHFFGRKEKPKLSWWNVIPLGTEKPLLLLGGIPLEKSSFGLKLNHGNMLKNLGVKRVLSATLPFESNYQGIAQPVDQKGWKKRKIKQKLIPIEDFKPVPMKDLFKGSHYIHESITKHKEVILVHCKAGLGRSVSLVMAYLIRYHGMTAESAHSHIQKARPIVNLAKHQFDRIKEFEELHRTICKSQ